VPEPQTLAQKNGHKEGSNGHIPEPEPQVPTKLQPLVQVEPAEENFKSNASDTTDTSSRLEAMSQDREALRLEVEKLRKQLEEIQEKHNEELTTVKDELAETEIAKDQAETNYQNLMGRVNSIKATLGERMAADKRDLGEARDQIEELEAQNESLRKSNQSLEAELSRLSSEEQDNSKELSSLRNRHNLSQQNWLKEREDLERLTKHLRDEADAAKEAMGDWEVLAMEERSIREGLAERVAELEDQLSGHKEAYERAASERDSQSQVVDGLQRALQEIQEARKVELREMVETTQAQLDALNKLVQQSDSRAAEAEAAKLSLETELQRTAPYEKEVKEKNLLIGKLRHEAIVLNDHLTKALRFLKKAKPEDNVDRSVSNLSCAGPG
jgi:chromosome segregation ATPase